MTAQVVIMNKEAVALASDSAVTIGRAGEKIFQSANKLFALSKYNPVGVMVYGNASFMGVPCETIVKLYRKEIGKKRFDNLKQYVNDFIAFLDNGNPLFPEHIQKEFVQNAIFAYFNLIKQGITEEVAKILKTKRKIGIRDTQKVISQVISQHNDLWENTENVPTIPKKHVKVIAQEYSSIIEKAISEVFEKLPLTKKNLSLLRKLATTLFTKVPEKLESELTTGIVIAGFGEKDIFPALETLEIEQIAKNKLKYKRARFKNLDYFKPTASIIPFAQKEMVQTFMEGIDPDLRVYAYTYLQKMFSELPEAIVDSIKKYNTAEKQLLKNKLKEICSKVFEDYRKYVQDYTRENNILPVVNVVSVLPKDELASMAETLVNLTTFKRRVAATKETVGGPIDVAVISKGDGFVWIKRKHYFQAELNPSFFIKYKGLDDE